MRRAVIRTVTASAAVPQFSVDVDVDAHALGALRESLRQENTPVSLTDLLHHAVARTLPHHPLLNATHTDTETLLHPEVNLAFIVEVDDGMLTPVISSAQRLDLVELAAYRVDLTQRARGGTLTPDEVLTGTFTVSNLGAFGVRRFNAMVLPPQSGVLAVGSADASGRLSLTLTVDHRVVDGAAAARFLTDLRQHLEDPTWISSGPARTEAQT